MLDQYVPYQKKFCTLTVYTVNCIQRKISYIKALEHKDTSPPSTTSMPRRTNHTLVTHIHWGHRNHSLGGKENSEWRDNHYRRVSIQEVVKTQLISPSFPWHASGWRWKCITGLLYLADLPLYKIHSVNYRGNHTFCDVVHIRLPFIVPNIV